MATTSDETIDWDRLDRFARSAGSFDERAVLAAWVESDPRIRELANVMRTIGSPSTRPARDAARALREVQRRLGMTERADQTVRQVASATPGATIHSYDSTARGRGT
jgi:hypothetical protein